MATFADRLTEAMQRKNISAAELSRISGVNEGAISQYRKGEYKASQLNLARLANTLDVSIVWLMGNDAPMSRTPEREVMTDFERKISHPDMLAKMEAARVNPSAVGNNIPANSSPSAKPSVKVIAEISGDVKELLDQACTLTGIKQKKIIENGIIAECMRIMEIHEKHGPPWVMKPY